MEIDHAHASTHTCTNLKVSKTLLSLCIDVCVCVCIGVCRCVSLVIVANLVTNKHILYV